MRKLLSMVVAVAISELVVLAPAHSDIVYTVNVNLLPTVPGTGGPFDWGYMGAGGSITLYGTQSPTYILSSLNIPIGSTIYFGQLDLPYVPSSDQYGYGYAGPTYSINSPQPFREGGGLFCSYGDPTCSVSQPADAIISLTTTYTSPYLQFTFSPGGSFIAAAVPELSTWTMLLIGFAGLGLSTAVRRPKRGFS